MNKSEQQSSSRRAHPGWFIVPIAAFYGAAMLVLVLSQLGHVGAIWGYVSMGIALFSALSAFGLGYTLAVTAESRQQRSTAGPTAGPTAVAARRPSPRIGQSRPLTFPKSCSTPVSPR